MKWIVLTSLAIIAAMFTWGYLASSRADGLVCSPAAEALKVAKDKFQAEPAFDGKSVGGQPVVVVVSPGGKWWMFLQQGPNLCLAAMGAMNLAPETDKPKTAAPALLQPHGLRWVNG